MLVKSQAKYIQSLGQKKLRDEAGVFVAEGPKIIAELLPTGNVQQLFAVNEWIENNKHLLSGVEIIEVSAAELERISQLTTPNEVLGVVKKFENAGAFMAKGTITLALDTIQDPGNLGTIIRTADWFGISQVLCSHECADVYNPKVVQSTMGSIARVRVLYTDIASWLEQNQETGIYAAALEGKDITTMKRLSEGIIIIGNESRGISSEVLQLANVKITIPRIGKAESLNAAVATGILLSHLT